MIIRSTTKPALPLFYLVEEVETAECTIWCIPEFSDEANIIADRLYEKVKQTAKDDYINRYFDFNAFMGYPHSIN